MGAVAITVPAGDNDGMEETIIIAVLVILSVGALIYMIWPSSKAPAPGSTAAGVKPQGVIAAAQTAAPTQAVSTQVAQPSETAKVVDDLTLTPDRSDSETEVVLKELFGMII